MSGSTESAISCSGRQRTGRLQIRNQRPRPTRKRNRLSKPVPVVVTQPQSSALEIGKQVLSPLINPLATTGIILVVTIFALLQKEDLRDRAIRLLGSHDLQRSTLALDDAGSRLSRYFLTQLGLNTSLRRDRRRRGVPDRRAASGAVGHSRYFAPVHSLYRFMDCRVAAGCPRGGGRSRAGRWR